MKFESMLRVQDAFVKQCLVDEEFRRKFIPTIDPHVIFDKYVQFIYKLIVKRHKEEKEISLTVIRDLIANSSRLDDELQEKLLATLDRIEKTNVSPTVLEEQIIESAITNEWSRIKGEIDSILDKGPSVVASKLRKFIEEIESKYTINSDATIKREVVDDVLFNTDKKIGIIFGIDCLDNDIGGVRKGDIAVIAGYTAVGKTWFLLHSFVKSVLAGLNVIFITLEMSLEHVLVRLIPLLLGKSYTTYYANGKGINEWQLPYINVTTESPDVLTVKKIDPDTDREVVVDTITDFLNRTMFYQPPARFYTEDVIKLIYEYKNKFGVFPDGIIIDGLEFINIYGAEHKDAWAITARAVLELKNIARDHDLSVLTMAHVQKQKENKQLIGIRDIAGGAEISRAASIVLTLNQTRAEYHAKIMRIFVAKLREGMAKNNTYAVNALFSVGKFANCRRLSPVEDEDWVKLITELTKDEALGRTTDIGDEDALL